MRLRRGKGIGRRAADEAETGAPLLAAASAAVPAPVGETALQPELALQKQQNITEYLVGC